jgi:biopolymer transport protein ExbD
MRTTLLAMAVPFLFCGCGCVRVPGLPEAERETPEVGGAKALEPQEYVIYLNVNEKGEVILPANEVPLDAAGNKIKVLNNVDQIAIYLKRKAKEVELYADPKNKDKPPRSVVILRVHAECQFGKTYPILRASQHAGFTRFQLRAMRGGEDEESRASLRLPSDGSHGDERKYVARVTSDEKGNIEKITLRGDTEKGIDLKTDVEALFEQLKELPGKHKDIPAVLTLEIDERLIHAQVVRLIDASVRAGFPDVMPLPFDWRNGKRCWRADSPALPENVLHHGAVYVRESLVAALVEVREPGVVEPHQVKDGRVQIVDVNLVLHRFEAEFVRRAVSHAALRATAREPHREAIRIVVTARLVLPLAERHPPELATPHDERFI